MRIVAPLLCLAALALAGCGPAAGTISGKVTYKDKPLPGGSVTFLTSDQKVKSATIGTDGTYQIAGVTVGPAKIGVSPPAAPTALPKGMKMDASKMGGAPEGSAVALPPDTKPVALPPQYQDPAKSGETYTVTAGKQEHDIHLK
jgi:hypothetical protein